MEVLLLHWHQWVRGLLPDIPDNRARSVFGRIDHNLCLEAKTHGMSVKLTQLSPASPHTRLHVRCSFMTAGEKSCGSLATGALQCGFYVGSNCGSNPQNFHDSGAARNRKLTDHRRKHLDAASSQGLHSLP